MSSSGGRTDLGISRSSSIRRAGRVIGDVSDNLEYSAIREIGYHATWSDRKSGRTVTGGAGKGRNVTWGAAGDINADYVTTFVQ